MTVAAQCLESSKEIEVMAVLEGIAAKLPLEGLALCHDVAAGRRDAFDSTRKAHISSKTLSALAYRAAELGSLAWMRHFLELRTGHGSGDVPVKSMVAFVTPETFDAFLAFVRSGLFWRIERAGTRSPPSSIGYRSESLLSWRQN